MGQTVRGNGAHPVAAGGAVLPEESGKPGNGATARCSVDRRRRPRAAIERRATGRVCIEIPMCFAVGSCTTAAAPVRKLIRAVTKDVSLGGLRLALGDSSLLDLPPDCLLGLELGMPGVHAIIRCRGRLRSVVRSNRGRDAGYLCVQFTEISDRDRGILSSVLEASRPVRGGTRRKEQAA